MFPEIEDLVGFVYKDQILNVENGEKEKIKAVVKSLFNEIMDVTNHEIISKVLFKLKSRLIMQDKVLVNNFLHILIQSIIKLYLHVHSSHIVGSTTSCIYIIYMSSW